MRRMEPGGASDSGARSSLSQLRRGAVEYCVLALLRDGERYGFELVRKLSEVDGLVTSEGTIYPLLTRLRRGPTLVTTFWRESETGPPPGATTSSPTTAARRSPASRRSGLDSATESTGCSNRREPDDDRPHERARRRLPAAPRARRRAAAALTARRARRGDPRAHRRRAARGRRRRRGRRPQRARAPRSARGDRCGCRRPERPDGTGRQARDRCADHARRAVVGWLVGIPLVLVSRAWSAATSWSERCSVSACRCCSGSSSSAPGPKP